VTAQPYQPADDRWASPATDDPDVIVVADDVAANDVAADDVAADDVADGHVVEADSADLTDASLEQDNLSRDDPAATESSPTRDTASDDDRPAADLGPQWHDIQAMFVDDPRGSVALAAAAADAAVSALAEKLQQRAALTQADADTEQLREALRSYRVFCQSLADFGRQVGQPQTVSR